MYCRKANGENVEATGQEWTDLISLRTLPYKIFYVRRRITAHVHSKQSISFERKVKLETHRPFMLEKIAASQRAGWVKIGSVCVKKSNFQPVFQ